MRLPPPESYAAFCERVLNICALYDCSETSGVRTPKRNMAKGGAALSKHQGNLGGWGKDIVPDNNTEGVRKRVVRAARILGLWVEDETNHIHVQGKQPGPLQ